MINNIVKFVIGIVIGLACAMAIQNNSGLLQQDTISRWNFTIVCKKGTDQCFCSYHRNPNDKMPTIGPCPFTKLSVK